MLDNRTKSLLEGIPVCTSKGGPRSDTWNDRLKEEYVALIKLVTLLKESDHEWFNIEASPDGKKWSGKCWYIYELVKYEFILNFEIPAAYPNAPIELALPELDGKTPKMYRGGKICLDIHFAPLWQKNVPKFGIAHALTLGVRKSSKFQCNIEISV
ncbi:putative Ufm1-conjugating enzyme 1 [Cardiosporidium cionae]|uniref:Ubiquitin-fold modifier-conjugating enzyme 1 n=1 Tax=Cardiosporidium cionae TaxID=476202 RepID=A0ABQ7JG73_9APIC|nr:putative Ufm1-conjugating enzyme 1 [Cardiosporidium cionae]|eukprot:KAF8822963.1 putative Ufm1-conjugating enzyme 1 [Cardiosporidium cionae]